MGNIGNLSGIGKMENGGGKLYCVSLNPYFSFYSSVAIHNVSELRDYLLTKDNVPVFGGSGNASNTQINSVTPLRIKYKNSSSFNLYELVLTCSFSGGQYSGGTANYYDIEISYTSSTITGITCVEV